MPFQHRPWKTSPSSPETEALLPERWPGTRGISARAGRGAFVWETGLERVLRNQILWVQILPLPSPVTLRRLLPALSLSLLPWEMGMAELPLGSLGG